MHNLDLWAWLLIGISLALAVATAMLYLKLRRDERDSAPRQAPRDARPATPSRPPAPAPPPRRQQASRRQAARALKQSWFVVFDTPSREHNRQLAELLARYQALYDAELGVYYITSGSARYQLTLAHSSSPGRLPPLHQDPEAAPVDGVSVLIKFINKQSVARHPDTFVEVVLAVQRIDGQILDAERNAMTPAAFRERFAAMPAASSAEA
ncbi:MAG: hypothetical protein ACQEXI_04420 [Pseudomonadota bacterium]